MSYIDFESEGIEYRLIRSVHNTRRKEPIDGLDALVVETGSIDPANVNANIIDNIEISNYLDDLAEREIPIYSVDNIGRGYLRNMATTIFHTLVIPPIMAYGVSKLAGADDDTARYIAVGTLNVEAYILALTVFVDSGISKFFAKINSVLSLFRQGPREELRNALIAKKIKKGVVPHLLEQYPERFQEQNPKIGIIYGGAHSSIKECLESDLRTDFSLALHRYYGLRFISDRNTLRDFYEYRLDGSGRVSLQKLQVESI